MKELFLYQVPTGTTSLGFRIFTTLKNNPNYILSKGLYTMVKTLKDYRMEIIGIHIKRTTIHILR
jgi:hypothetical protein